MTHLALSLCPSPPPSVVSGPEQGPRCYLTHWQSGSWTQDLLCVSLCTQQEYLPCQACSIGIWKRRLPRCCLEAWVKQWHGKVKA